jgi:TRAP transporter TAXI family solute receptor
VRAVWCVLLLIAIALAGCGHGPDADVVRKDVAARLAEALPDGEVSLAAFHRRGSQADVKAPSGETRRVVYFDAELKLERDFDFGGWSGPGIAGLVSALGAGPKGISGIEGGGNKANDRLHVHGAALYARTGNGWTAVSSGAFRPSVAPAYATNEAQGTAAIVEDIRKVIDSAPKETSPATRAIIEEELAAANAAIRARLARAASGYAIAAGPEHGQYLRLARALAEGDGGVRATALITHGGEENLRLLREGKVSLALAQGDAALEAYEGRGNFAGDGPSPALRAMGSLYPEPVHVLVRADSALTSPSELRGRRVAIGPPGSASRTTALRVLEAHGLAREAVTTLDLPLNDALVALRQHEADAVIQVIGVPADSVRDALAAMPLRLLPLAEQAVVALTAAKSGYFPFRIPRGAYATQKLDVRTVATAALLLAGTDLSDTEVATITRFVFGRGRDFAARGSAQGTQVSAATARQGLSVPQHTAAAKALEAPTAK